MDEKTGTEIAMKLGPTIREVIEREKKLAFLAGRRATLQQVSDMLRQDAGLAARGLNDLLADEVLALMEGK